MWCLWGSKLGWSAFTKVFSHVQRLLLHPKLKPCVLRLLLHPKLNPCAPCEAVMRLLLHGVNPWSKLEETELGSGVNVAVSWLNRNIENLLRSLEEPDASPLMRRFVNDDPICCWWTETGLLITCGQKFINGSSSSISEEDKSFWGKKPEEDVGKLWFCWDITSRQVLWSGSVWWSWE